MHEILRARRVTAGTHFAAWASVGDSAHDAGGSYWNNLTTRPIRLRYFNAGAARRSDDPAALYASSEQIGRGPG